MNWNQFITLELKDNDQKPLGKKKKSDLTMTFELEH